MAWYLVKEGGTAATATDDGRVIVQPTGSFAGIGAANYYNDLETAFEATTPPTTGDILIVSDTHDYTYAAVVRWVPAAAYPGPRVISVDDTDVEVFKAGAKESSGGTSDFEPCDANGASVQLYGFSFGVADDIRLVNSSTRLYMEGGTLDFAGNLDRVYFSGGGNESIFKGVTFAWPTGTTSPALQLAGGAKCDLIDCVMDGGSGTIEAVDGGTSYAGTGGVTGLRLGCDFTDVDDYLVSETGAIFNSENAINLTYKDCLLSATLISFSQEVFSKKSHFLGVYNCSSVSAEAEYQWYELTGGGTAENVTTIYRNETIPFPSGVKCSIEAITTALVDNSFTKEFTLSRYATLSTTSTIEVYITSDDTLTELDIWVEVTYPDGTNKNVPNFISTQNTDPFATGTELTSDASSTWTGAKTNSYVISLDTSIDPGADSVPVVTVQIAGQSKTIYVDRFYGVV